MQAVVVLKVTLEQNNGVEEFSLNMPLICMKAPAPETDRADLAEVMVVNDSGRDIELSFPPTASPLDKTIPLPEGGKGYFSWNAKVKEFRYTFTVSRQLTDTGGHVESTTGTIEIEVMG